MNKPNTNKKLLREWKKIANTDIFVSFDDFVQFYYANGEKCCYRKYTNENWSKDNFFWGTYEELLEFYKVDTTIPCSAQQKIGEKYGSLTILSLFAENTTGKKVIYARCKCDCGNETIKVLRDVVKGDVLTCGGIDCRQKRNANSFLQVEHIPQSIIAEHWNYEKNMGIDPATIPLKSKQLFWWEDCLGNEYQLAPCVYDKNETSTSFPEQTIFYYIHRFFPSAINKASYLTYSGNTVEIDIYIPTLNIGIEYDGAFWHQDRLVEDMNKNAVLDKNGIHLIRVREHGLDLLDTFNCVTIARDKYSQNQDDLVDIVNQILDTIKDLTKGESKNWITKTDFEKDLFSIYSQVFSVPVENNISKTCLGEFWSEKNQPLRMECISINSTIPLYFQCGANRIFQFSAKSFFDKLQNNKYKVYACHENLGFNPCDTNICCPFRNLGICESSISVNCLSRKRYGLPLLKCLTTQLYNQITDNIKPISKHVYNNQKSCSLDINLLPLFKILFDNKSAFSFSINSSGSFWLKNGDIERFEDYYFSNERLQHEIATNHKLEYTYCIPYEYREQISSSRLILYHLLFKEENMRGWWFYIFLIIDIDKEGHIINQESKIIPKTAFGSNSDFYYNSNFYCKKDYDLNFVINMITNTSEIK